MDIPLPGETDQAPILPPSPPPMIPPPAFNIPLPSCGMQFNSSIPPPLLLPPMNKPPPPLLGVPLPPPPLPSGPPPSLPPPEQDDSNKYSPSRATMDDDIPILPPLPKDPPPPIPGAAGTKAASRATVLGKAQAKKRLLAFSMTKQGGGAGLSFGFARKAAGRVSGSVPAKAFGPGGSEEAGEPGSTSPSGNRSSSVSVVDAPPVERKERRNKKKVSTREDRARAVVSAIEEIKREELMMRGLTYGGVGMAPLLSASQMNTGPLPLLEKPILPPTEPKNDLDPIRPNMILRAQRGALESLVDTILLTKDPLKGSVEADPGSQEKRSSEKAHHHHGSRSGRHAEREERRSSKDRERERERRRESRRSGRRRSARHGDELPVDWKEFHSGGYRIEEMRRLKLKLEHTKMAGTSAGSRDRHSRRHRSSVER